jgi:enamine deaminase RidA (YjgF/YER057c/UK114 family)
MKQLLPEGWPQPKGYSNGVLAEGRLVFVAGMIGWDERGRFADDFVDQLAQVLRNTVAVLAAGGAAPEHIVRMTWYVKGLDRYRENLAGIGRVYREIIGRHFPAMAVVGVTELVEAEALIEIETTACLASGSAG